MSPERNLRVLQACDALEEHGQLDKSDEESPHSADLRRLDFKLNLLLDLAGQLLAQSQPRLKPSNIRFNAMGASFTYDEGLAEGAYGVLELMLRETADEVFALATHARGLLQVMPITARHICRDHKIKCDIPRLVTDTSYNAMIGSAYIGDRKQEFDGSYVLTLAGYNAGPGRARQWMRRFGDAATAFASGWMRVRGNRRRRGFDRGFVLSDHIDWPDLLRTIQECGARRVLATHGYSDTLARFLLEQGLPAAPLETRFEGEYGGDEEDNADGGEA